MSDKQQERYEEEKQDRKKELLNEYPTNLIINDLINEVKNSNLLRNKIAINFFDDFVKSYFDALIQKVDLRNENNISNYLIVLSELLKELPTPDLYNSFRKELINFCIELDYLNDI